MSDNALDWRDDDDAPRPGATIGPLARFAMDGVYFTEIGDFSLLVLRCGESLIAFWNLCPHQFLPLNWRSDNVLSADGSILRCSNHDAAFRAADGEPAGGAAPVPCGLSQVPIRVSGDVLIVDDWSPA